MALVKGFFGGEEGACAGGGAAGERSVSRTMSFAHRGGGGGARARSGGGGARRVAAIGRQFQDSLDQLMAMLKLCSPHFVRCVKPNYALEPNNFDGAYVMRQLRQVHFSSPAPLLVVQSGATSYSCSIPCSHTVSLGPSLRP